MVRDDNRSVPVQGSSRHFSNDTLRRPTKRLTDMCSPTPLRIVPRSRASVTPYFSYLRALYQFRWQRRCE